MHSYRTHNCAELRDTNVGETVRLSGWVHRKRDHGNLLFIDLRDHYGITQCVIETEFSHQFKLAIVDFIQDHYLTKKAYELGLDKTDTIYLNESLWADSFTAYQSAKLLMSTQSDSVEQHILMKPIIDNLQKKYSPQISINMKLFESIKISSIDMFVTQGNVPYPVIVPSFPSFTNDSYIDYGSKIN